MLKRKTGVAIAFLSVLLVGTTGVLVLGDRQLEKAQASELEGKKPTFELPMRDERLVDHKKIYETFEDSRLEAVYITVLPPKADGAIDLKTLHEQVNETNDVYHNDTEDPFVNIYLSTTSTQVSNDQSSNGTMELRGQSSRISPQKSYKIKLDEEKTSWHGMTTLNMNKHFVDKVRIKNKLAFDYFQLMPDIISYRTKFVELFVRDLSNGKEQENFTSYGLFTFIEQPNKQFLKDHGLDPKGYFYKAEFFEFQRYPEDIKTKLEQGYAYDKFESKLETRGNDDHTALIEMLDAVNDYTTDINEVVDTYFNEDNMLTWLAVNILINNYDTSSRNFMIYSPLNFKKWYFIPWDYDSAWKPAKVDEKDWQFGLANYWGMTLFNRYFRYPENVEKLNLKMEELSQIITPAQTKQFIESYMEEITPVMNNEPDQTYLDQTREEYLAELEAICKMSEENKARYYKDLQRPMPFYLVNTQRKSDEIRLEWGSAFDLQGDPVTYEVKVSQTPDLGQLVYQKKDIEVAGIQIPELPKGTYYWQVIACDDKGNTRYAFDYVVVEGKTYIGTGTFEVQ